VDVAVIRLPRIANFDDFDPLAAHAAVRLRYVARADELGTPDLVILPGSKTTRADLDFVRERGLDARIRAHADRGGAVIGICGGYQMLGQRIDDPDGLDGPPGTSPGLGLLAVTTRFASEKATVQVRGHIMANRGLLAAAQGTEIIGYQIHIGQTVADESPLFAMTRGNGRAEPEGAISSNGRVLGTYLHGLFRNPALVDALVGALAADRDIPIAPRTRRDDPYDRLAAVLRNSLDVNRLRAIAGLA
jgi:adenosylcobyric acid synthase